ncbi:uncharacterized protein EDB93DRAFT_1329001 [Suillus bovinus]|uniref:uncharacterized protein n=1 Tax=Suillus bovinus TaxID=48563 RepID=UPI001B8672CF|nr:uncharacterized protein EDB93DRAFT_1329001 [Suillus bovinus]KAG2146027.1 hypothetical protein EDB93DRAFT_1329001 [Suillus bovinus]
MVTTDLDAQQISWCAYAVLAGNSILIYDHLITLPEEITFIWRRPKTLAAMLFLLNRYLALLGIICSAILEPFIVSDEVCSNYTASRQLDIFLQGIVICMIMAMRTYALYGCSKRLFTLLTIIIIALVVVACAVTFVKVSGDAAILPGIGCYEVYTTETSARIGLAWVAFFVFDLLIFVLTVYKICKTRGFPWLSLITRRNIFDVVFQDGAMYFGAMALINIPNILTYYSASVAIRGGLCDFTSCISVTLTSRLMLNLHNTIHPGVLSATVQDNEYCLDAITTRYLIMCLDAKLGMLAIPEPKPFPKAEQRDRVADDAALLAGLWLCVLKKPMTNIVTSG